MSCSLPVQKKASIFGHLGPRSQTNADSTKPICNPRHIPRGCPIQPHLSDPHRYHAESDQIAAGRIEGREVHEHEVTPVLLMPTDSFVVIDEVAAAIKDQPVSIDLDRTRMMGRVAVDDVNAAVDQPVGKLDALATHFRSPLRAPMAPANTHALAPLPLT